MAVTQMRKKILLASLLTLPVLLITVRLCPAQDAEPQPDAAASLCPFAPTSDASAESESGGSYAGPKQLSALRFLAGIRRHFKNPVNFFTEFHARNGKTFKVNMPCGMKFLFDTRQEALSGTLLATDAGDNSWEKPPLQGHGLSFLMGTDNVFLGKGAAWKNGHNAMKPYLDGKAINSDATTAKICAILDEHINQLKERATTAAGNEIDVDVRHEMQNATLDVALRLLLGTQLKPADLLRIQQAFGEVMAWLPAETLNMSSCSLAKCANIVPGTWKLKAAYQLIINLADSMVAQRRASGSNGSDLLGGLLSAVDTETGRPFDDKRLRNEIITIILAGHETTATLTSWTMAIMARNPAEFAKVQQSVASLGADAPPYLAIRKNNAVDNVVKETLRLYSPAYFLVRRSTADTALGPPNAQVPCPKGTTAVMSTYHAHRDEELWGMARTGYPADEFHPDRFEKNCPKMYPFGGGVRVCLGQHMAKLEASLMLVRFAQLFDMKPVTNAPLEPYSDISVHPNDPMVKLHLRKAGS
jgi:cytochrome P450